MKDHEPLLPRRLTELVRAVGFLALILWFLTVFVSDDLSQRLSRAGDAVAAIAVAAAVYTLGLAVRGLELQRRTTVDDHSLQRNSRLRERYADLLAHANHMVLTRYKDIKLGTVPEWADVFNEMVDRDRRESQELLRYQWRIRLLDPDPERQERTNQTVIDTMRVGDRIQAALHVAVERQHPLHADLVQELESELDRTLCLLETHLVALVASLENDVSSIGSDDVLGTPGGALKDC